MLAIGVAVERILNMINEQMIPHQISIPRIKTPVSPPTRVRCRIFKLVFINIYWKLHSHCRKLESPQYT